MPQRIRSQDSELTTFVQRVKSKRTKYWESSNGIFSACQLTVTRGWENVFSSDRRLARPWQVNVEESGNFIRQSLCALARSHVMTPKLIADIAAS